MNIKQKLAFYKSKIGQHSVKNWREVAKGSHYWSKSAARVRTVFNPRVETTQKRWVEDVQAAGLRFVGYADEVVSLRHTGWFTDDQQGDKYRGAVWQLPARNGESLFVYGYEDGCNPGSALIDFDVTNDKGDAARWADGMAERDAEDAREWYAKDQAEQQVAELAESIVETRADVRRLLAERRQLKRQGLENAAVCELFAERVGRLLGEVKEHKARIAALNDNFWLAVE